MDIIDGENSMFVAVSLRQFKIAKQAFARMVGVDEYEIQWFFGLPFRQREVDIALDARDILKAQLLPSCPSYLRELWCALKGSEMCA